jgi:hypothetical protein
VGLDGTQESAITSTKACGIIAANQKKTAMAYWKQPFSKRLLEKETMNNTSCRIVSFAILLVLFGPVDAQAQPSRKNCTSPAIPPEAAHNVILFIADGLRHDAVTPETAPTMFELRQAGVDFINSHSLFPTLTTPNASAFATGHQLGDTGDFGNALFVGHPVPVEGGSLTPFIEDDLALAAVNGYFEKNRPKSYIGLETLVDLARSKGYAVAVVGKQGPAAIQDINEVQIKAQRMLDDTCAIVIDDQTDTQISQSGTPTVSMIPLSEDVLTPMTDAGLNSPGDGRHVKAPSRNNGQAGSPRDNGYSGTHDTPGTLAANVVQQQFFADAVTQAILPLFKKHPFFLVFWSRDPDGTQHNQGDSLNQLRPGINGPTSHAAIRNADNNLAQIMNYLKTHDLFAKTDIIVVADHGFSTISKREIDSKGTPTGSYPATNNYEDVEKGFLPPGFVAIDLAHELPQPLFDPDIAPENDSSGKKKYKRIDFSGSNNQPAQHPKQGNGIIGGTGKIPTGHETEDDIPQVIVAANGGGDLIYFPLKNNEQSKAKRRMDLARRISQFLLKQDYTDGVFLNCTEFDKMPGTLCMEDIGLAGTTNMPQPAMVINFKTFSMDNQTLRISRLTRVEIADTPLQEGQGMHGSFSRADTFNNMTASGPDFKETYVDQAPVSNADIAVTIACALKWKPCNQPRGTLQGRILKEALRGGPDRLPVRRDVKVPVQSFGDIRTTLFFQTLSDEGRDFVYYDEACLVTAAGSASCP